jgi:pimeloyl-ACP methyl ester carboxylesterase
MNAPDTSSTPRRVVLIHGLGRSSASMAALAHRLRRRGFAVDLIDYPSRQLDLQGAIAEVERRIGAAPAHLVGHSLGGVIALAIKRRGKAQIGRVVQIGSPNLGSGLAERVREAAVGRWWLGPVLDELAERDQRGPRDPDVAAIAGTGGERWATRHYGLRGPNDGKVSVRSAWGRIASHRAAVGAGHTLLPLSAEVARLVAGFINDGRFPRESRPSRERR